MGEHIHRFQKLECGRFGGAMVLFATACDWLSLDQVLATGPMNHTARELGYSEIRAAPTGTTGAREFSEWG